MIACESEATLQKKNTREVCYKLLLPSLVAPISLMILPLAKPLGHVFFTHFNSQHHFWCVVVVPSSLVLTVFATPSLLP